LDGKEVIHVKSLQEIPDYSLEAFVTADEQQRVVDAPHVDAVVKIEVESPELRCMKGDCQGDYAPG
jgi:hypothetical protein